MGVFIQSRESLANVDINRRVIKKDEYTRLMRFSETIEQARSLADEIESSSLEQAKARNTKAYLDGVDRAKKHMAANLLKTSQHIQDTLSWVESDMPSMLMEAVDDLFAELDCQVLLAGLVQSKLHSYREEHKVVVYLPAEEFATAKEAVERYVASKYPAMSGLQFEVGHHLAADECVIEGAGIISRASVSEKVAYLRSMVDKSFT